MADKKLNCRDCGSEFAFTEGEQEFYAEKNFPDPVRCPECRKLKKEAKKNGNSQNSN